MAYTMLCDSHHNFAGGLSVFASAMLIVERNAQVSSIVSAIGVYAMFYGALLMVFSLRLHAIRRHSHLVET